MKPAVLAVALLLVLAAPSAHGFVGAIIGLIGAGISACVRFCWVGGVWSGTLTVNLPEGPAVSCATWIYTGGTSIEIPTPCEPSEVPLLSEISLQGMAVMNWDIGEKACKPDGDGVKVVEASAIVRDPRSGVEEQWGCALMRRTGDDKVTLTFGPMKETEDEAVLACPTAHGAEAISAECEADEDCQVAAAFMELTLQRDGQKLDEALADAGLSCE